ncbi:hypothetical protein BRD00_05565 [Halobacteriales archaeon QS_8_69_26]|nr:MAG: hypothetical protein BRD00_05565 [Halobacteriales archaeon QS_8_69_26]
MDEDPRESDPEGAGGSDPGDGGSDGGNARGSGPGDGGRRGPDAGDGGGRGAAMGGPAGSDRPPGGVDPAAVTDDRLHRLHDDLVASVERAGDPREVAAYLGAVSLKDMRTYSDREVFEVLLDTVFAPGRPWTEYERYRSAIHAAMGNYRRTAEFDEADVQRLMETTALSEGPGRIRLAVLDARAFRETVADHGSFPAYLRRFEAAEDPGEVAIRAVRERFRLGPRGAREFLSNVGFRPVVRRELTAGRTLARVGLVPDPRAFDAVDRVVERMADVTGRPWAVVDRLFWCYGFGPDVVGMDAPVCDSTPNCGRCLVDDCAARRRPPGDPG